MTVSALAPGVGRGFFPAPHTRIGVAIAGTQPFRLKLDVVHVRDDEVILPSGADYQQTFMGAAVTGAWLIPACP